MSYVEVFNCPFDSDFYDVMERHNLTNNTGVILSSERKVGNRSAFFDGASYLTYGSELQDFELGSFSVLMDSTPRNASLPNNNFTLEGWIRLNTGGGKYYPVCSSFNFLVGSHSDEIGSLYPYKCGWVLQVDTTTGTLELVGYHYGNWVGSVLCSPRDSILFNKWTHFVIQSWHITPLTSYKLMYIDGQTTTDYPIILDNCSWTNTFSSSEGITRAFFYVGVGPRSQYTDPGQSWWMDLNQDYNETHNYRFHGWIDDLKLSIGPKYDAMTFLPGGNLTTSTTIPPRQAVEIYIADGLSNLSTITATPIMTSPVTDGVTITGTGNIDLTSFYAPFRAFDVNPVTQWIACGITDVTLNIDFGVGNSKAINKYRFYCNDKDEFPVLWIISGSHDLAEWDILDLVNYNSAISSFWTEWFYFSNSTPYRYYKIVFNLPPFKSQIKIGEIKLIEAESYINNFNTISSTVPGFIRVDTNGTPLASSQLFECEPSRAFDNNENTFWSPMTPNNQWIGIKCSYYFNITRYTLTTDINHTFDSWKFQASNDGNSWVDIHTGNFLVTGSETFTSFTNTTYYLYYRILILNWVGAPGLIAFELWATPASISSSITTSTITSTTASTTETSTNTTTTSVTFTQSSSTITSFSTTAYNAATTIPPQAYLDVTPECVNVTSSSNHIDHEPITIINNRVDEYWSCSVHSGPPYWVKLEFTNPHIVDEYVLYTLDYLAPKSWDFQASDNDIDWISLDTVSNYSNQTKLVRRFINSTPYFYYRMYISDAQENELDIQINQLRLFSGSSNYNLESTFHYVGYHYNSPKAVSRYCFYVKEESRFTDWKLQGSNDGIIWVDVDVKIEPEVIGWKVIELTNIIEFTHWRLIVLKWGLFTIPKLCEVEFYERAI